MLTRCALRGGIAGPSETERKRAPWRPDCDDNVRCAPADGAEFGASTSRFHHEAVAQVPAPLQVSKMPLANPPPRENRFGSPLNLSKVHWVRPVVVEVTYLTWTEAGLLLAVSYQGQREDKLARQMVRPIPHPPSRR